jgi:uncharacterized repeat protein (TIGR03803 family)
MPPTAISTGQRTAAGPVALTAPARFSKSHQTAPLTTLYNFRSQTNCADGSAPDAALVYATDGNLYGTTYTGGAGVSCPPDGGCGTVFEITPRGAFTTLYSFCSPADCADGENPEAPLLRAPNLNFYGTTFNGGANGGGTVYQITSSGTLTVLHSFCALDKCADGQEPIAGLLLASNGDLWSFSTRAARL